jgi:sRNA-binding carbon storage regulator CsrA
MAVTLIGAIAPRTHWRRYVTRVEKAARIRDITVTVLAVKGKQGRFGINALQDVTVHREESLSASEASSLQRIRRNVRRDSSIV